MLFFAYFYIAKNSRLDDGRTAEASLLASHARGAVTSSGVLYWGEQQVEERAINRGPRRPWSGRCFWAWVSLLLTYFEDVEHLKSLTPRTDAYGSIFYTIVSLHGLHVCVGLLMLCWVFLLRRWEPRHYSPHRPFHNVAMYWHFVDTVWVFVVA